MDSKAHDCTMEDLMRWLRAELPTPPNYDFNRNWMADCGQRDTIGQVVDIAV